MIVKKPSKNLQFKTSQDFKYFSEKENVLVNLKNHYINLLISSGNGDQIQHDHHKSKTPKLIIKNKRGNIFSHQFNIKIFNIYPIKR